MCFPDDGLNGNKGHGEEDVLYIGFTGKNTTPGKDADWTGDRNSFEASIKGLGDQLVAGLSV
jgi:chitosanase